MAAPVLTPGRRRTLVDWRAVLIGAALGAAGGLVLAWAADLAATWWVG